MDALLSLPGFAEHGPGVYPEVLSRLAGLTEESFLFRWKVAHSQGVVKCSQLRRLEKPVLLSMPVDGCGRMNLDSAKAARTTDRGSRGPFFVGLGCRVGVAIYVTQMGNKRKTDGCKRLIVQIVNRQRWRW